MGLITVISTFFSSSTPVHASDLVLNELTGYSYTVVSPHLGYAITTYFFIKNVNLIILL